MRRGRVNGERLELCAHSLEDSEQSKVSYLYFLFRVASLNMENHPHIWKNWPEEDYCICNTKLPCKVLRDEKRFMSWPGAIQNH